MAFIDLSRDLFENVTISLTPKVTYTSGSTAGITGSAYLMPLKSKRLKEIRTKDVSGFEAFAEALSVFGITNLANFADEFKRGDRTDSDLNSYMGSYLNLIGSRPIDVRYDKNLPITRIEQPTTFTTASVIKRNIKNILMPHYRTQYDDCGFYYRNYHTLNFFTGSNFNTGSVLIYPNKDHVYHNFLLPNTNNTETAKFTLQFWVNPRYKNDKGNHFHPGTIFHISSSIAVSLISGSQLDQDGNVASYKILSQFKHTAEISPDQINFNSRAYPNDLWITSSFELKHNNWHHATLRWSPVNNNKTGSLIIDNNETQFAIPSASLFKDTISPGLVGGICIGNHFKGPPASLTGLNNITSVQEEGTAYYAGTFDPNESTYSFNNPLNAELHEIKYYNAYINDNYIVNSGSGVTQKDIDDYNLRFYLPPYFYPESFAPRKQLYAPGFKVTTSSYTPTNNLFAFAADGKEINLENFTRDMIQKLPPRHFHLTASTATSFESVDQFMFDGVNAKRNLTILPNDNGLFNPNYYIIQNHVTGTSLSEHYTGESYNNTPNNYDLIKLENALGAIAEKVENKAIDIYCPSLQDDIFGGSASTAIYSLKAESEIVAAINDDRDDLFFSAFNELKEDSSNYIAIFNISNLYYGNQIKPSSFQITDASLTGSQGKIGMTLKDNGHGGVYRADCLTKQADWNIVGNLFYDEGLLLIKSPHLSLFGKDHFETSFKGEQNVHSLVINVPAPRGFFDKSVNPSFVSLPKTSNLNDENTESIVITGINIHDENFNIIMRANLAQPIIKDKSDEFVIRLKMDF
jgi:hypothetical protein